MPIQPLVSCLRALGLLGLVLAAPARALQSAAPAPATRRADWVELPRPANLTVLPRSLGTSLYFQTATHVYLWSAITAKWTSVAVGASPIVTQYNAYITIEDGGTVHAFATRTGRVETLVLPAVPQVFHGPASSNWLSIVVLGREAWSFGAFDGTWHHTFLTTSPSINISQLAGLVLDGTRLFGVSAYHGEFVQAPLPATAMTSVGGDVAAAWTATDVAGFSAYTGTWSSRAATNPVSLAIERGYAMFADGADLVAFSSCTGTFNSHPIGSGYTFQPGRYVAAASVGNDVVAYSCGQGRFEQRSFASPPTVYVDDEVLAVQDSAGVTAFSVVGGAFTAAVPGAFTVTTNDCMVWLSDGVNGHAYVPVRESWSAAPIPVSAPVQTIVLRDAVVLADASGYRACSGRSGNWSHQPTSSHFSFTGPTSGDLFVALDGAQSHAFDPVIDRWSTLRASPIVASDVWRQTFVGHDGTLAHGFGLMNNLWSSIRLQGAVQSLDANSSCGFVLTSTHVYAYSAHGALSTLARFPEFSRLQAIGVPLRLIQVAPPGAKVIALLASEPSFQRTANGFLFLDPTSMLARIPLQVVPPSGLLDFPLDLSNQPALQGKALHIQTLVQPQSSSPWLSNSIAPVIL